MLKVELLKVSPPVHYGVVCVGLTRRTPILKLFVYFDKTLFLIFLVIVAVMMA
jgi:hypothetical protein